MEKELVEFIARSLVDEPKDVSVNLIEGEQKSPAKTTRSHSARLNSSTAKRTLST